ncbi:hypothetical protein J6590_065283 [Homalodisca vitripennis]|nr:hypothetical protein J6590_065283 [Homalodisca vitripennis]
MVDSRDLGFIKLSWVTQERQVLWSPLFISKIHTGVEHSYISLFIQGCWLYSSGRRIEHGFGATREDRLEKWGFLPQAYGISLEAKSVRRQWKLHIAGSEYEKLYPDITCHSVKFCQHSVTVGTSMRDFFSECELHTRY